MTRIVLNHDTSSEVIEQYCPQPEVMVTTIRDLATVSSHYNGAVQVSVFIHSGAAWQQDEWFMLLQIPTEGIVFYTTSLALYMELLRIQSNVIYITDAHAQQLALRESQQTSALHSLKKLRARTSKSSYMIQPSDLIRTAQTIEATRKPAASKIQETVSKKVPKVKDTVAKKAKKQDKGEKPTKPAKPAKLSGKAKVNANPPQEVEDLSILEKVRAEEGKIDARGAVSQLQQYEVPIDTAQDFGNAEVSAPEEALPAFLTQGQKRTKREIQSAQPDRSSGHQSDVFGKVEVHLEEDAMQGLIDSSAEEVISLNSGLIMAPIRQAKDILSKLVPTSSDPHKTKSSKSTSGSRGLSVGALSMEKIATEDEPGIGFGNGADDIQLDRSRYHVLTYTTPIEYLIGEGILPRELKVQLTEIQAKLKREKHIDVSLEDIIVMNGILTEAQVIKAMSRVYNVEVLAASYLASCKVNTSVYPRQVCKKYVFIHTNEDPRELVGIYGNRLQSNLGANFGSARVRFALATSILARIDAEEVWQNEGISLSGK